MVAYVDILNSGSNTSKMNQPLYGPAATDQALHRSVLLLTRWVDDWSTLHRWCRLERSSIICMLFCWIGPQQLISCLPPGKVFVPALFTYLGRASAVWFCNVLYTETLSMILLSYRCPMIPRLEHPYSSKVI